jgi:membrane associated rhomboid family serine protease
MGMPSLRCQVRVLGGLVASFWALCLLDLFLPARHSLLRWGIRPHEAASLPRVFIAPFLHGGFLHLCANTVPFLVLGWLVLCRGLRPFLVVSLVAAAVSGLGIWLLGSSGEIHLGASGVIFGYLGYLLLRGSFERSLGAFLLGLAVCVVFGGALWGVLPLQAGVSWQGHLFGFLGGVLAAWLLAPPPAPVLPPSLPQAVPLPPSTR